MCCRGRVIAYNLAAAGITYVNAQTLLLSIGPLALNVFPAIGLRTFCFQILVVALKRFKLKLRVAVRTLRLLRGDVKFPYSVKRTFKRM